MLVFRLFGWYSVGTLEVYGSNDTANVTTGTYPTNWSKFEFGAVINVDTTNSHSLLVFATGHAHGCFEIYSNKLGPGQLQLNWLLKW